MCLMCTPVTQKPVHSSLHHVHIEVQYFFYFIVLFCLFGFFFQQKQPFARISGFFYLWSGSTNLCRHIRNNQQQQPSTNQSKWWQSRWRRTQGSINRPHARTHTRALLLIQSDVIIKHNAGDSCRASWDLFQLSGPSEDLWLRADFLEREHCDVS